jgi:2-methylisocitrate lyase-like PEP mutase family enzyme
MGPREAHVNPHPAVEWTVNLLAENGNALIGIGTAALAAAWCAFHALCRRIEHRHRSRYAIDELQQYANDPTVRTRLDQTCQPRKEKP